jgi:hypothetical protein
MKDASFFFLKRTDPLWSKILIIACTAACILVSGAMFFISEVASIEIPPEVEKKTVSMRKDHAEAELICDFHTHVKKEEYPAFQLSSVLDSKTKEL